MKETKVVLEMQNLSKTYKGKKGTNFQALDKISCKVYSGEIVGILGPNGAGKTTALKIIMGFLTQDSGKIFFLGKEQKFAEPRINTGYLPESFKANPNLTVLEYIQFHCGLSGIYGHAAKEESLDLLRQVGMDAFSHRRISALSKGMGQRVGFAQAFVGNPDILILDEPTSGLDPVGRSEVIDFLITKKNAGKTIFFCSHILSEVEQICDRIGILVKGKLTRMEPLDAMIHNTKAKNLEEVFKQEVLCGQL